MSSDSGRLRLLALWLFLSIAAVGLSLILASLLVETPGLLTLGAATLATGALCFLVIQFWTAGTASSRPNPQAPSPVPAAGRGIDFTYSDVKPAPGPVKVHTLATAMAGRHHSAPQQFSEELVEFQLAPPEAPTTLQVPPAFQVEAQADAAPSAPAAWLEESVAASTGGPPSREFVPAVERRREIVSGLPLLSQIFSEPVTTPREPATAGRPDKTRGQCGSCGTFIWAPTQRPIRLRCPKCGHVKTLTE